ncbi:phosphotransferase [Candidatus Saccharibacteria bacterium]|nr:phosphotransferase [Candidatus Saccharibacteria bacterium]
MKISDDLVVRALLQYGVCPQKVFPRQSGYRNKSFRVSTAERDLNLIFFKREPGILERINRADAVSEFVAAKGLPVRRLHDQRTLELRGQNTISYARLYNFLPGATIAWELYTMKHIKLLGQAMSDLHAVLEKSTISLPSAAKRCEELNRRMEEYFSQPNVCRAMAEKLKLDFDDKIFNFFSMAIHKADQSGEQIPLHLDLVRGNVLYNESSGDDRWQIDDLALSGIIDFENVARGSALFDLARTYAFLLVDCAHKTPEKIYKYLIISGYNKRGMRQIEITRSNETILQNLTRFYLFYDFYKFLRHNPYESLAQNHHFCRTRDILIQKNMLV